MIKFIKKLLNILFQTDSRKELKRMEKSYRSLKLTTKQKEFINKHYWLKLK